MKKIIFSILVLFTCMTAYSQMGLTFGLHGLYSSIWIQNQNSYKLTSEMDYEYKYGATAGLSLGYNWATNFGMQVEFNYSQNGQLYEDIMRDFSQVETENPNLMLKVLTTRDIDLNYLQVPIMFKMQQGELKDAIKYHFMGGVVLGYLISADQIFMADVDDDDELNNVPHTIAPQSLVPEFVVMQGEVPMEDYFQRFNLGLTLDLGADVYLNDKTYLSPSFRGFYGLNDINSEPTRELGNQIENPYSASHIFYIGINLGINWYFDGVKFGGGGGD